MGSHVPPTDIFCKFLLSTSDLHILSDSQIPGLFLDDGVWVVVPDTSALLPRGLRGGDRMMLKHGSDRPKGQIAPNVFRV